MPVVGSLISKEILNDLAKAQQNELSDHRRAAGSAVRVSAHPGRDLAGVLDSAADIGRAGRQSYQDTADDQVKGSRSGELRQPGILHEVRKRDERGSAPPYRVAHRHLFHTIDRHQHRELCRHNTRDRDIDPEQIENAAAHSNARGFIEKLPQKYDTPLMRFFEDSGTELSGGQWQKTAIARVLFRFGYSDTRRADRLA